MSNETKIGILAVVAIGLSLWGYKFIMGSNMFSSSLTLKTEYADIAQLSLSNPIFLNGKQIGVVSDIYFEPNALQSVIVEMDITERLPIPKTAKAELMSTGLIGGKGIELKFEGPCSGANCAEEGDKIEGVVKGFLENYLGKPTDTKEYMDVATEGLGAAFDTLSNKIAKPGTPLYESYQDIDKVLKNLTVMTDRMNRLLSASSGSIEGMLASLNTTTTTLEQNNEQISRILTSTANFTTSLEKVELETTLKEAEATFQELQATLETTNAAMTDINKLTTKVSNGEGTIGKLMEDEELYNRLNQAVIQAEVLMTDLQEKPYRYMPLKSRKRVMKYDEKDEDNEDGNE